jgi:hypothetical protein
MKQLRPILLKTMLWALGFGAVAGVAAILMGGEDVVVRVMATAFITSGAALLLIPISLLVDRRTTQATGLFLMAAIVVEYLIWVLFTWIVDTRVSWDIEIRTALTGLWLLLALLPVTVSVRLVTSERGRFIGWCAVAVCSAAFVCLLLGTWTPNRWWAFDEEKWWGTALAVFAFGALALACLVPPGPDMKYVWRWLGPPVAATGLVLWLLVLWAEPPAVTLLAIVTGAAVAVAHANMMLLVPLRPGQRWLLAGTIGTTILGVLLLDVFVYLAEENVGDPEWVGRLAGAAGILACCGSLAMLVLARLNRRVDFVPLTDMPLAVTVICPRCKRKAKVPLGSGACGACGLRIQLNIEEPRCPECGYLIYKLTSDRCPECGTSIQPAQDADE